MSKNEQIIEDTFFKDPLEARRIAQQKNTFYFNRNVVSTQICYYTGEKKLINTPYNCIYVPTDDMLNFFVNTKYRLPTKIEIDVSPSLLQDIKREIVKKIHHEVEKTTHLHPDFSEKKLRVFIPACRDTIVLKNVSKAIAKAFENFDVDVRFHIQENDLEACSTLHSIRDFIDFNPHILFLINHLEHDKYKSQGLFRFIWFQDRVDALYDDKFVYLQEREYIFSLLREFQEALNKKNIPSERQGFCANELIFKKNPNIIREKKIVFIGSSYADKGDSVSAEIIDELIAAFSNGSLSNRQTRDAIFQEYLLSHPNLATEAVEFVVRDLSVLWLCSIESHYKIEIYGDGWDKYDTIKPFYKGVVPYGKKLADIYNSATFALAPHSLYLIQQRTLEAAACGCIPILYDIRSFSDEIFYDEAVEYFKTQQDLATILTYEPQKKDFSRLLNENSYTTFAKKMLDKVQQTLNNSSEQKIEDTYFLNSLEAKRVALQNKKFFIHGVETTQICFHHEIDFQNAPENCIFIPHNEIVTFLSQTKMRLPTTINFNGYNLHHTQKIETLNTFVDILTQVKSNISQLIREKIAQINLLQLNPKDKKIRIYFPTCRNTLVLKNISKSIAREFEKYDEFEVYVYEQKSDLEGCGQLHDLEAFYNFNPHVVFMINHLNREIYGSQNENLIKFTWYQDRVNSLYNTDFLSLEPKEHIYALLPEFAEDLNKKNIPNQLQSFCLNESLFKQDKTIKREKKIVFIGSSYSSKIGDRLPPEMMEELVQNFLSGELSKKSVRDTITSKYLLSDDTIATEAVEFIVRDLSVIWLCSLESDYTIEVYGKGWECYEEVVPFYKGVVEYGKELADIYNSATYALAPHSIYILQQRTLESSACGCIPIVYDIRDFVPKPHYNEAIEYFKTQDDLANILKQEPKKKEFSSLLEENSYKTFVKRMVELIKKDYKGSKE
jgi:hypothetical protein